MTQKRPVNIWLWAMALLILVIAAVFGWEFLHQTKRAPIGPAVAHTFQPAPQIEAVADVPRVAIKPVKILVLEKHAVAKKLDLPALERTNHYAAATATPAVLDHYIPAVLHNYSSAVPAAESEQSEQSEPSNRSDKSEPSEASTDDGALEVLTTADLPPSDNGSEAVTLLDTKTGESSTIVKEKLAPWFQFQNGIVAGMRYGLDTDLKQTGTAYAGWEFLRVKDLHFIGYGEVNTAPSGKVQLDIQYRRK